MLDKKESVREKWEREAEKGKKKFWKRMSWLSAGFLLLVILFLLFWPTLSLYYYENLYRDGNSKEKRQALRALAQLDNPKALGVFIDELGQVSDEQERYRKWLEDFIRRWAGTKEIVPLLKERINSAHPQKQIGALRVLHLLGPQSFLKGEESLWEKVEKLAYASSTQVRRAALVALKRFPQRAKIEHFIDGLHSYSGARIDLRIIIQKLATPDQIQVVIKKIKSPRKLDQKNGLQGAYIILEKRSSWDVPALHQAIYPRLQAKDDLIRFYAILCFQGMVNEKDIPHLLPLVDDSDKDIRQALATVLGELKVPHKGVDKALWTLAEDRARRVREEAVLALAQRKVPQARGRLINLIRDEKNIKRLEGISLLAHYPSRETIDFLIEVLHNKGDQFQSLPFQSGENLAYQFQEAALEVLSQLKGIRALPHIWDLVVHLRSETRRAARRALLKIKGKEWLRRELKSRLKKTEDRRKKMFYQEGLIKLNSQ